MTKKNIKGQSLFEIVFAVGIAALVLVGVVSLATVSVRNTEFSQSKTKATKLAQEATEWLREQRDLDWDTLGDRTDDYNKIGIGVLDWEQNLVGIPDTQFNREVKLVMSGGNKITATVTVSWTDSIGEHVVEAVTIYTDWTNRL